MLWKSYRAHGDAKEQSQFAGLFAAFCIGLIFAAPWILLAVALSIAKRWLFG
jgi:hypothetical protein